MTPRLLSLLTITLARIGLFYKSQQVHYYTREGKTGDQVMLRGNRAIAEHQADGTALRLFVAVGNRPGSGTRTSMSANSQSTQNVLTSFAGHLAASSSTRGASGQRREFVGERVPICMLRDSKNLVATGRYERDGDAVW